MRKNLLLITLLFSLNGFSQTYSYGFKGALDQEQHKTLEAYCQSLDYVDWIKINYKEDSKKGEIIIQLADMREERAENDSDFSPIDVKRKLTELGLEPLSFVEIELNK